MWWYWRAFNEVSLISRNPFACKVGIFPPVERMTGRVDLRPWVPYTQACSGGCQVGRHTDWVIKRVRSVQFDGQSTLCQLLRESER